MRKLIINADDLGLSESVNEAIIDVYRRGNLTSATLMVNMPATDHAAKLAKENPGLAVGLHFCLTEGKSIGDHRTLTDESGYFHTRSELLKGLLRGSIEPSEVRQEFEAQMEQFGLLGLTYTHVDSHQHVMMFPPVFDAIEDVLRRQNSNFRVVRPPMPSLKLVTMRPAKFFRAVMNRRFAKRITGKALPGATNDLLVAIHDLVDPNNFTTTDYVELVRRTPKNATIELMVHPYKINEQLLRMYSDEIQTKAQFLNKCEQEYRCLTEKGLFNEFTLINYSDIRV